MTVNIKGAVDNASREILSETMMKWNLSSAISDWLYYFIGYRKASMLINGVRGEEKTMKTRDPQGSPISTYLFLLCIAPLYELIKE